MFCSNKYIIKNKRGEIEIVDIKKVIADNITNDPTFSLCNGKIIIEENKNLFTLLCNHCRYVYGVHDLEEMLQLLLDNVK